MQTMKARRWCFTWNNYTKENVDYLKEIPANKADFIIFGFERAPETDTPHLQGYVEFSTPLAMSTVKTRLDPMLKKKSTVHIESAYKNRNANVNYVSKTETKDLLAIETYGCSFIEVTNKEHNQGARTDWHDKFDFIKDKPDYIEFAERYPEDAIKYHGGVNRLIEAVKQHQNRIDFESSYEDAVLRSWQQQLVNELSFDADDRKIIWIYEKTGNCGKSWVSRYLVAKHNAIRFENAATKDIALAYNGESIVVFDYCRSNEEHINYQILESLKNGMLFSAKYNSCTKYFRPPHVVCFANWPPKECAMSMDRWSVRNLDDLQKAIEPATDPSVEGCVEDVQSRNTDIGDCVDNII